MSDQSPYKSIEESSEKLLRWLVILDRLKVIYFDIEAAENSEILCITSYRLICPFCKRLYIRILRDI